LSATLYKATKPSTPFKSLPTLTEIANSLGMDNQNGPRMTPYLPIDDLEHIFSRVRWDELRSAKVLITGGTGYVGLWLLESLLYANERLALNARIAILSRHPSGADYPNVEYHGADVRTFETLAGFTHIIHAAGPTEAELNYPLTVFDSIVDGTRHLLDFTRSSKPNKMLVISSGAVYGVQPDGVLYLSEDSTSAPNTVMPSSSYGEAKRAAELLSAAYAAQYSIPVKIARLFTFIGPGLPLDAHFAVGNFIGNYLAGEPIRVKGDGTPQRSYMYASDMAIWLWTILLKASRGSVYNVGSDRACSISELAHRIAKFSEPPLNVSIRHTAVIGKVPERYVPDINKAKTELGLDLTIGLDEAIKKTVKFYQEKK
jgi:nucleoside-diphosphate-sugar epimerase